MKKIFLFLGLITLSLIINSCQKTDDYDASAVKSLTYQDNPYTFIQNKYADAILNYEFGKSNQSYDPEDYEFEEKIAELLSIDATKSNNNTDESRADVVFYDSLCQAIIYEVNSHFYVQSVVNQYAISEMYDENDINMPYGYDCQDFISKMNILKLYENGVDVIDFLYRRDTLTGSEAWNESGADAVYVEPRGMQYTLHSKWTNNIVEYMWNTSSTSLRNAMSTAMNEWKSASNNAITFKEITKHKSWNKTLWLLGLKYFININLVASGNFAGNSSIGRVPWATIRIKNVSNTTCRHEMGHSLGLLHEHQRPDRDDYIVYYPANVQLGCRANFVKAPAGSYNYHNSSFDFSSIMLYGSQAYANQSGVYTMLKLDGTPFVAPLYISETDCSVIQQIYY